MLEASVPKRCDIFDGLSVPSGVQLVLFNIIKGSDRGGFCNVEHVATVVVIGTILEAPVVGIIE